MNEDPAHHPEPEIDTSTSAVIKRLGPAAVLGVLWAAMPAIIGLTVFLAYRQEVADWLREQGMPDGGLIYVGAFALCAGLGLLPTWVQAVIGGYAFGMWTGFGLAWAGFSLAALIGFGVTKVVAGRRVEREIESHPKALAVRNALVGKGWLKTVGIVALVRAPFNSPFSIMNLTLTAAETPLSAYLLGTIVGMAPRTLVYAWIGGQVESFDTYESPGWIKIAGIVSVVVVALVVGQIGSKAIEKVTGGAGDQASGDDPAE